jgi:hypothetical protein
MWIRPGSASENGNQDGRSRSNGVLEHVPRKRRRDSAVQRNIFSFNRMTEFSENLKNIARNSRYTALLQLLAAVASAGANDMFVQQLDRIAHI